MTLIAALLLAAGVLLIASTWLWPRRTEPGARPRPRLDAVADLLARAGVSAVSPALSPTVLVAVIVLAGLAGGALSVLLVPVLALAPVAALVAASVPVLVLRARAASRRRALRGVWPDVVDLLLSGVRAGLSLPQGVAALADSAPEAVRGAFLEFRRDYVRTAQFGESLDALKFSLADPVSDRIIETLRMAREVGGTELPAVLRSLSTYLRADASVRGEIDARQSWVRTAARLGVVAPWIVLLMLSTRPEAVAAYNSAAGAALVLGGLGATLVAYRMMIVLGRLPDEGRWFR